jgi:hypothetical protein
MCNYINPLNVIFIKTIAIMLGDQIRINLCRTETDYLIINQQKNINDSRAQ